MTVPECRARRYGRERAYDYLVKPVPKVDKQKISKDEFRKLMQGGMRNELDKCKR